MRTDRLTEKLVTSTAVDLHAIWSDALRTLSKGHRAGLLRGLRVLVPAVAALGSRRAVRETAVAIDDVGTWWP